MSKYVRETAAGKALSVYVILKGRKEVATVLAHFGSGGSCCLVNVFQRDTAAERSARAASKAAKEKKPRNVSDFTFQHARAGGYGYDKLTAALSGLWVDGHEITDHCGRSLPPPKGRKTWPRKAEPPKGYRFANYHSKYLTFGFDPKKHLNPNFIGEEGYTSCYRESGLDYLKAIGYSILRPL